jgi:crotonobetainyl-CoA:carnitine CoA-transferase CaiB-like acyl-CoA transferase
LDFTWVISGPQCTQILADFGAEVIRVEWPNHVDGLRYRVQPQGADSGDPEMSGLWNNLNRNKRGITLNMRHPDGADLAVQLIEHCDVVVENFRPGVLASWGLSFERMLEANPRLVYLSMSGFGWGGPNEDYVVFAPVMQALSGLYAMTARPGHEPAGLGFSYADHVGGYFGALAVLAALHETEETRTGVMIDLGQVEASIALTSSALLDLQVNGRAYPGEGNVPLGSIAAPCDLYPCAGDDAWCAISIDTDAQWQALCAVVGLDALQDGRFTTVVGRQAHREAIDRHLKAWTSQHAREHVVTELASAGVPCTAMATALELLDDPVLGARGYFQTAVHDHLGERTYQMGGIAAACGPLLERAAPTLGEANAYVFGEILGLADHEIATYVADAVI